MKNRTILQILRANRCRRTLALFMVLNILIEIVSPAVAYGLTAGASQPEFSSFEPVATTDMVNDLTGDFTYNLPVLNVPGPDGGGYAMSLSYHSGVSSEEEASWVGFGWTLNPGAINRNKRGYADEFDGVDVVQYNKVRPNWTQTARFSFNMEYNSSDAKESKGGTAKTLKKMKERLNLSTTGKDQNGNSTDPADISFSLSHTIRYNNYTGFSIANGFGVGTMGMANLSMNRSGGQNTFGFSVNPQIIMRSLRKKSSETTEPAKEKDWKNATFKEKLVHAAKKTANNMKSRMTSIPSHYAVSVPGGPGLPYSVTKNSGMACNFSGSVQWNPTVPVGFQVGVAGHMNVQVMEGLSTLKAYGYMHSHRANGGGGIDELYDFELEKESTFDKSDKTLGIPFNNADIFSASGNNVIGGFRLRHDRIGTYYPNHVTNELKIRQIGAEIGLGTTMTAGLDVGVGKQKTIVEGHWPKMPKSTEVQISDFSSTLPQMRFSNDPGGELSYGSDAYDDLVYAKVLFSKRPDLGPEYVLSKDAAKNSGSSYIRYWREADADNPTTNKMISGVDITSKDGRKSSYRLPVYTRNEMELTVDLEKFEDGKYLATRSLDVANPLNQNTAIGKKITAKYASSYLLTSNTEYNYVDADGVPGPSDGDFGGWTKFEYSQAYGGSGGVGNSQWYRYRSPYAGLLYNQGRRLDPNDQTGSMSCGEKQVYYLKNIETKSHIAFFVTNTSSASTFTTQFPIADYPYLYSGGSPINSVTLNLQGSGETRYDGLDAMAIGATHDPAAEGLGQKGSNHLQRLEKIVLFAKHDLSRPLNTTFFEYDYSLCQGIPNISPSAPANSSGKLTLKKVWTESAGITKSLIAPYQFHYEYFHQYPSEITARYPWTDTDFNNNFTSHDSKQNPRYEPGQLDAWGFYQENGEQRFTNGQTWVSQKTPSPGFDPAAWQLKRIQLPSGGEVHVHYEQKDYTSVQDLSPMAMVSLLPDYNQDGYKSDESVFCINASDLEVNSSSEITEYAEVLDKHFRKQKNKLYFKVLYAYTGDDKPQLNTQNRRYEYATGYTAVNSVSVVGTAPNQKILLGLGETANDCTGGGSGKMDKTLPRYVCYQDLLTNGGQNLGLKTSGNILNYRDDDLTAEAYAASPVQTSDISNAAAKRVLLNTVAMFTDWVTLKVKNVTKKKACKELEFEKSYFKLPVYHAKKGGGIRVKRLLTYDPGIENGDAMIYGSEYLYVNEDGTSSGVATNEPQACREESALVSFVERKKQKWLPKILNGKDTKQDEGPIGESILPGASVVHSRIIVKNIHSGKSGTGYSVTSYHTSKDFPVEVEYSAISKKDKTYRKFNLRLPLGLFNLETHRAWLTQGYLFKLNDMNGKIESKANYAGEYDVATFKEGSFVSKTSYKYSAPGEKISSLVYDRNTDEIKRENLNPGTEEDYTIYMSNVKERSNDFTFEMDFNLTLPILPSIGFAAAYSFCSNLLCQHVTSKVVSQTSHLIATTSVNDGVTQTTENLMFDRYTNEPVFTRTYDGYLAPQSGVYTSLSIALQTPSKHQGYFYSLNIPASWMYDPLGPKTDDTTNFNQLSGTVGNIVTYGENSLYEAMKTGNTWSPINDPLEKVVSASAVAYSKNWFSSTMATEYPALNTPSVLSQANQVYYPWRTFAYRENVSDANASSGKIYDAGWVSVPFKFFKWGVVESTPNTAVDAEWYSDSRATRYSPNGVPIEEIDTMGISSTAEFGYDEQLPVLVARNSKYKQAQFKDFEYGYAGNNNISTSNAHTGRASFNLSTGPQENFFSNYELTPSLLSTGISVKLWLKSSLSTAISNPSYEIKNSSPQLKAIIGTKQFEFKQVTQTGEWTLYSADIFNFQGLASGAYNISLSYNFLSNENVYVDDIRIQPVDASVQCSVYHTDNRLAAQFDDQHFAVFYEYNTRGQLVRKSIETEKGRKTLQEQQYNTPLISTINP